MCGNSKPELQAHERKGRASTFGSVFVNQASQFSHSIKVLVRSQCDSNNSVNILTTSILASCVLDFIWKKRFTISNVFIEISLEFPLR